MNIKTLIYIPLLGISSTLLANDAMLEDARSNTQLFGKTLKGEVMKTMKAGGPLATVSVCKEVAPKIAKDVSQQSGWDAGRTSLKLRNPENAPDSWELAVLQSFEERKAKGEPVKTMEYSEVVDQNGAKTFRYMKAIPTEKPCLSCHAADIQPEVEAALMEYYPADKARGFKLGDIRGAFTLSKPIQ